MTEYEVEYKKPPTHSRFKKGICPNPRGRGARKPFKPSQALRNALNALTRFRQNNRSKSAPLIEVFLRRQVMLALQGNAMAAAMLLELRAHFSKYGDVRKLTLVFDEADAKL